MVEEKLRKLLYAQIRNRAMMCYYIFKELREEVGKTLAEYAPNDLEGLKKAFIERVVPDDDHLFKPEVLRCDGEELEIKLHMCPLKDAFRDAGLGEDEMATMLSIAAQVDYGTFEGAGFDFSAETWRPGRQGCCHLHIRPKR
jgi:hypothetical protein